MRTEITKCGCVWLVCQQRHAVLPCDHACIRVCARKGGRAEGEGLRAKGRTQKAEAKGRDRRTESEGQKAEDRKRRTESGGQKAKGGGRRG